MFGLFNSSAAADFGADGAVRSPLVEGRHNVDLASSLIGSCVEEVCVVASNVHVVSALVSRSGVLRTQRRLMSIRAAIVARRDAYEASAPLLSRVIATFLYA